MLSLLVKGPPKTICTTRTDSFRLNRHSNTPRRPCQVCFMCRTFSNRDVSHFVEMTYVTVALRAEAIEDKRVMARGRRISWRLKTVGSLLSRRRRTSLVSIVHLPGSGKGLSICGAMVESSKMPTVVTEQSSPGTSRPKNRSPPALAGENEMSSETRGFGRPLFGRSADNAHTQLLSTNGRPVRGDRAAAGMGQSCDRPGR